jgi:lysophospholipase L1-like esterase
MNPSGRQQLRLTPVSSAQIALGSGKTKSRCRRIAGALATTTLAALVVGQANLVAVAAAHTGPRVTVALYGDSVTEAYTIPNFLKDGLSPLLEDGLVRAGFSRGGSGFIAATPFRWKFGQTIVIGGQGAQPPKGWLLDGFGTQNGLTGLSGYSALGVSTAATATAPIDAPTVAVLYTKYAGGPAFTASAGGQSWTISTASIGPPQPTETWLTVPAGATTLTITGPPSGEFIFDGAISRRPVVPGTVQTEVENLGHEGHLLGADLKPMVVQALTGQSFGVSVFLGGYLYITEATTRATANRRAKQYAKDLRRYADLARTGGGKCLIADPSPLPSAAAVVARFDAIDRSVASAAGCTYTSALTHLWSAPTAVKKKLTLVDDIHPTAAGYRLIVRALMPSLAKLVRQAARG